jgi:sensor c-di-GMP phosphodiesterase-like protein
MGIDAKRAAIPIAAAVIAAALGMLAGFVLGRALVLRHTGDKLDDYAIKIRTDAETSAAVARATLATVNASPYPYCSEAEIAWLRRLIFQSEFLKDGGHMRDGRIGCSATLGQAIAADADYKPDFTSKDGTHLYLNLPPLRIENQTVVTIQKGDSFMVYSPFNLKDLGSESMRFTVTETDNPSGQTGRLVGELTSAEAWILTREGRVQAGNSLYVTRCSTIYPSCMTAFISVPEAMRSDRRNLAAYIALCGACGALFGLACSLIYRRRRSMERQLRRAIRKDKLRVVYQPIVSLATRRIVGAEALVRWNDDDRAAIPPDVFVKVAEERGFVGEITSLIVRHVLNECRGLLRTRTDFRVNVNIAAADLSDPRFLPMLDEALARERVGAERLGIEITESYTARQQVAKDGILRLRERGHKVHIDDFGTGYSSLAYLHDLSVDGIKIDRAFTRAIGTGSVTVSIIPQILSMAAALNLQVTVEGIETTEQADYFAASEETILAQGWLFGRPVPVAAFQQLLTEEEQKEMAVLTSS